MSKKTVLLFGIFSFIFPVFGEIKPISTDFRDKIVAAIYKIEGGSKTKYPFGIKSINTGGDYNKAKRICENTVANNYIRWQKAGKTNDFIEFLGNRYCPVNAPDDPKGLNKNWVRNLKILLAKKTAGN